MKGKCNHCGVEHPLADLAGYNVRFGGVVAAICNSCYSILGCEGGDGWFERIQKKIRMLKAKRKSEDRLITRWVQGRIDGVQ